MIIYLVLLLPIVSSDLPGNRSGKPIVPCLVLLRMGFTYALPVTSQAVVSYTAFPPLPAKAGGLFLLHWPGSHLHRTLSGILPCEARTFLTPVAGAAIICRTCCTIIYVFLCFFNYFLIFMTNHKMS